MILLAIFNNIIRKYKLNWYIKVDLITIFDK